MMIDSEVCCIDTSPGAQNTLKKCPWCLVFKCVKHYFGYRVYRGKRYAQSACTDCRNFGLSTPAQIARLYRRRFKDYRETNTSKMVEALLAASPRYKVICHHPLHDTTHPHHCFMDKRC